eukprot:543123_1
MRNKDLLRYCFVLIVCWLLWNLWIIFINPLDTYLNNLDYIDYTVNGRQFCSTLFYPLPLFLSIKDLSEKLIIDTVYDKFLFFNSIQLSISAQTIISLNSSTIIRVFASPNIHSDGYRQDTRNKGKVALNYVWNRQYLCVFINKNNEIYVLSKPVRKLSERGLNGLSYYFIIDCDLSSNKHKLLRNEILSSTYVTNVGLYILNLSTITDDTSNISIITNYMMKYNMLLPVCSTVITENVMPFINNNKNKKNWSIFTYDKKYDYNMKYKQYNFSICTLIHFQYATKFNDRKQTEYQFKYWIGYHMHHGIDHFYIYQHLWDDRNDETLFKIVENMNKVLNKNIITFVPWYIGLLSKYDLRWFQHSQINDCLNRFRFQSEWILFIDIDEFMIPEYHHLSHDQRSQFKNIPNHKIKIADILQIITQQQPDSNVISLSRYDGIPIELFMNDDNNCSMRYNNVLERQYCILPTSHFYFKKYKGLPKSMIKTNEIYAQRIHFPTDAIIGKQINRISNIKMFILHTVDHHKILLKDEEIKNGTINIETCMKQNQTMDVLIAMKIFDITQPVNKHNENNIKSLVDTKNYVYCYQHISFLHKLWNALAF